MTRKKGKITKQVQFSIKKSWFCVTSGAKWKGKKEKLQNKSK